MMSETYSLHPKRDQWVKRIILTIVLVLLLKLIIYYFYEKTHYLTTTATIIDYQTFVAGAYMDKGGNHPFCEEKLTVEYNVDGRMIKTKIISTPMKSYHIGMKINIRYKKSKPDKCHLAG